MGETLTGKQRDRSRKETEADETEAEERRGANLHVCGGRVVPVLHQLLVRVVRVGVVVLRCQLELFGLRSLLARQADDGGRMKRGRTLRV
eukprot:313417-Rhodomonas_salina.1